MSPFRSWSAEVAPLIPDGDEARRWAEEELADPVYDIAEPTTFDRIARAVGDFISGLFSSEPSAEWGTTLALIAACIVIALIVIAFVIWGVPRSIRRAPRALGELFGEAEERSADELRRVAASHAAKSEWDAAIIVRMRALARSTAERAVVRTPPGATVHSFARSAAKVFPASATDLETAASIFDDVRYLRRPGSGELYEQVAGLDRTIAAARPRETEPVGASR
ncbi:DUF4129 domain-containing protein [Microbacterium lacus]|uniref:DUF4129 domain-containing protein n=1 Tax=Microbacterium lacus TaxID=415217 RepID=UPI00384F3346